MQRMLKGDMASTLKEELHVQLKATPGGFLRFGLELSSTEMQSHVRRGSLDAASHPRLLRCRQAITVGGLRRKVGLGWPHHHVVCGAVQWGRASA